MRFQSTKLSPFPGLNYLSRLLLPVLLVAVLGACSSQAAREAEIAEQVAAEQEAVRLAEERERQQLMEQQRRREAEQREQARLQAQREREEAEARAREEAERLAREEAERREQERQAEIARLERERQARLQRIAELEQQIADIQAQVSTDEQSAATLEEAVLVAEELLEVLTAEQAKYENTDEQGNTVEPLAKDLIAELEEQRENLQRQLDTR